jgi:hypothetical protein
MLEIVRALAGARNKNFSKTKVTRAGVGAHEIGKSGPKSQPGFSFARPFARITPVPTTKIPN